MNDHDIDELLKRSNLERGPEAETLRRITASIAGSMGPVRPLPSRGILFGTVALICAAVALAGASALGFAGITHMSVVERAAVFSMLGVLILAAASELVSAMIPASRRRFSSRALVMGVALCLAVVLAACFRDYQTTHFLHAGLVCLGIGLLHAVLTGLFSWLVLRRGFAVDAVSAGLAAGTLAGLSGVGMLELHCPNFQAAHVLVWHVGVLLMSAGLGALCGWGQLRLRGHQRH